jgi:hypothetical protein
MPTFSRRAVLEWNGDVMDGAGETTAATDAFAMPADRIGADREGEAW